MSRADIVKRQLEAVSAEADVEMAAVRAALPAMTKEELREHIRRFVLYKFLLDPDCEEEDIRRLSQMSIEKLLAMSTRDLNTSDLGIGCGGTSSVDNKIILLFMALGRELEITMDPLRTPSLKTVPLLTEEVYTLLKEAGRVL